jgi:phenazine biosynthesis protein phzE
MTGGLLARALAPGAGAFALLHRPDAAPGALDVLRGNVSELSGLAAALPPGENLLLVPYRQVAELGHDCRDDGAPLLAMTVAERERMPLGSALALLPDVPVALRDGGYDVDDEAYEDIVRRVVEDEIGTGEGCNFVIKRSFTGVIEDYSIDAALTIFRRLLAVEHGAYWTFLVHTGDATFVGASPERHVTLNAGIATMNPISGTYRYPDTGPAAAGLVEFLADGKETDELYMVLDEELKMMGAVCERGGGRVEGPYLKEMAHLAHTEYFIAGPTSLGALDVLRHTMLAPTVVGSPLANAFRVISRHERTGRRYYSGVVALVGPDEDGTRSLDSAILIRTAEISAGGAVDIGVGATLVRHSKPAAEVAETRAKADALLAAMGATQRPRPSTARRTMAYDESEVALALRARNAGLASFWFTGEAPAPEFAGRRLLVVDAEDRFTAMLAHQLASLGFDVTTRPYDAPFSTDGLDYVLVGPGPGDPGSADAKMVRLREITRRLLAGDVPFLSVCLGHQVLSGLLGLPLIRRDSPNQGVRRAVDLFGRTERVGFYNTFVALSDTDAFACAARPGTVEVSRDRETGQVHALRGPGFASVQFHAESVLTEHGPRILADLFGPLAGSARRNRSPEEGTTMTATPTVTTPTAPYKLVSRQNHAERSVVRVGDATIGPDTFTLIAGPCAVETPEQTLAAARLAQAAGATMLRGGAFKPRTSPYSFQGLGADGLKILADAGAECGLPVVTEVVDSRDVELVAEYADMLQVGTRNMHNFGLLHAIGDTGMPVLLKRGMSATIEEWLLAAEHIAARGNTRIVLCERGIRTFETATRNTLDLSAVLVAQRLSHLPVIVDPSHASGDRDLVIPLARAAVAVGADGVMVDIHPAPAQALCDGPQALVESELDGLGEAVRDWATLAGRLTREVTGPGATARLSS